MNIETIKTDKAPAAVGPYSQAVRWGNLVFTSGMIPIDMGTGDIERNCIKRATKIVLTNISELLKTQGMSLSNVVKTTVFMADLSEFDDMNEVYGSFFTENLPARSTVQAAGLPKGVRIEIETIAVCEQYEN